MIICKMDTLVPGWGLPGSVEKPAADNRKGKKNPDRHISLEIKVFILIQSEIWSIDLFSGYLVILIL